MVFYCVFDGDIGFQNSISDSRNRAMFIKAGGTLFKILEAIQKIW